MACPPVFILSCERSGSTLLRYILDTHPDICCPGELALGPLVNALRFTASRTAGLIIDPEESRRQVQQLATQMVVDLARARGKKLWCDKTPANLGYLDDLRWAFPDARYICLYRLSTDVVASCLDISRSGFMAELAVYAARNPHNLVTAMMENWVDKTERLIQFETAAAGCIRIHYEALVQAPESVLRPLLVFLGVAWDPSLLDRVFTTPHDPGGGDPKIRSRQCIEGHHVGAGLSQLDPAYLGRLPTALVRRMQELHLELGYPL